MAQPTPETSLSALRPMLQRPIVAATLILLCVLVGVAVGRSSPITYRAETRLAVGPTSNSAYVISGFPLAARDLAANYSRWVQNNGADRSWGELGLSAVRASPIPDSGVIRIEAESTDRAAAAAGARQIADRLTTLVGQEQAKNDPALALAQYEKLAPQVASAQAAVENARTNKARQDARVLLAKTQLQRDAFGDRYRRLFSEPQAVSRLRVIQPAVETGDSRFATTARWGLIGLGAGVVLALLITTLMHRRQTAGAAEGDTPGEPSVREDQVQSPDLTLTR